MSFRCMLVATSYPELLKDLYAEEPELADLDYDAQRTRILVSSLAVAEAYSAELMALGNEATEVIVNADSLQHRWALENGVSLSGNIHDRRRQIVAAQIDFYRPDVLFVYEWCPLGDAFLADIKPQVGLLVGQIASAVRSERSYSAYDLMISSWPPIVEHFREEGKAAQHLRAAFDSRILDKLPAADSEYDVSFVGGFAPVHTDRAQWLERLLQDVRVDVFGYGLERAPVGSPVRKVHHGPVWGLKMYDVLRRSRLTLHHQATIDVRGKATAEYAAAIRLYEATGVGTCLLTESKEDLSALFDPDKEIVTFRSAEESVEKIRYYLAHPDQRRAIARAGQERTLRDHTYKSRIPELCEILRRHL